MDLHHNVSELKAVKSDFLDVLGDEFVWATGFGIYAHLSHGEIDRLFKKFISQTVPVRAFARRFVVTR